MFWGNTLITNLGILSQRIHALLDLYVLYLKVTWKVLGSVPFLSCLSPPRSPGQVWQDLMTLNLCNEQHLHSWGNKAPPPCPHGGWRLGGVIVNWTLKRLSSWGGQRKLLPSLLGESTGDFDLSFCSSFLSNSPKCIENSEINCLILQIYIYS